MVEAWIAGKIMTAADISLEAGQTKYRVYFINTLLYAKYKAGVDLILQTTESVKYPEGYGECIVTA